jgi:hypothetical protein
MERLSGFILNIVGYVDYVVDRVKADSFELILQPVG